MDARSRPSDDLPKDYKRSDEHGLNVAKYIYSMYLSGNALIRPYEQDQIRTNRNYAYGRQDMQIYEKKWDVPNVPIDGTEATEAPQNRSQFVRLNVGRLGKDHINFKRPLNPLPKFISSMIGVLSDQEHDVTCTAIDERSTTLKQELEFGSLVDGMFKPSLQYLQMTMEMGNPPDMAPKPSTIEELEMWRKVGTFKLGYEAAAKDAWVETERLSDVEEVKNDILRSLLEHGKAVAVADDVDGLVKFEALDIADVIMEDSKKTINRDPGYFAYMKYITLTELRAKCPWLGEQDCKRLIKDFGNERGLFDNSPLYGTQQRSATYLFESTKIPILYFWMKTIDFDYNTHVKNDDGITVEKFNEPYRFRKGVNDIRAYKPEDKDWRDQDGKQGAILKPREYKGRGKRLTNVDSDRNVLCGAWVMGNDILFDYDYQTDLAFDYFSRNALIPAVGFKLEGASWVERMIPIADEIEMEFLYIQDTMATSPKPGIAIDWKSMSSVPADNGKFVHPFDMITIGEKTGRWLYTIAPADPHNPVPLNQKPISEVMTALPQVLQTHIAMVDYWYRELERQGGISDFMTGGSPQDRQGLGVSQIVLQTNTNSLKPVYNGWVSIKERIANFSILKIQSLINGAEGNSSPYFNILGAGKYAALKSAGKYPPVYWGFKMIPKISDLMKQEIFKMTEAALGLGKDGVPQIQYSQAFFVFDKLESGNLVDIRMYMAYLEQKRLEEAQQRETARKKEEAQMAMAIDDKKKENEKELDNNRAANSLKEAYLKHKMELERRTHDHMLTNREKVVESQIPPPQEAVAPTPAPPTEMPT